MTGNETDSEQQNEGDIDINQMTVRAETAAQTTEAALKVS